MSQAHPKMLFVLTSHSDLGGVRSTGLYFPELVHPYLEFKAAGYDVDFVSVKGGRPPFDGVNKEDPEQRQVLEDAALMARIESSMKPSEINPEDYDLIFYIGGHGTMWDFPDDQRLATIASSIYEQGGLVAAVCHGPAGLVNIRLSDGSYLVNGKMVTAFTNEEEKAVNLSEVVPFALEAALIERGANFSKAAAFQPHIEVDGRLATGQNPASARLLARAVIEHLTQSRG